MAASTLWRRSSSSRRSSKGASWEKEPQVLGHTQRREASASGGPRLTSSCSASTRPSWRRWNSDAHRSRTSSSNAWKPPPHRTVTRAPHSRARVFGCQTNREEQLAGSGLLLREALRELPPHRLKGLCQAQAQAQAQQRCVPGRRWGQTAAQRCPCQRPASRSRASHTHTHTHT
jgi:hypothetical protein